jgi:ubiquinone/menaquinone biosynthesis C-methylase UbiE
VVFADISRDLLGQCERLADVAGVRDRCRLVEASAEQLAPVETASVDAVTVRSVLIYVADKEAAFGEFARVLRPADARPWDVYLHSSGNPNLQTLAEAMERTLTDQEQARLTRYLRPLIEDGAPTRRMAHAYVRARRAQGAAPVVTRRPGP